MGGADVVIAIVAVLLALALAFFAGRALRGHPPAGPVTIAPENLVAEIARLQERERNLAEENGRLRQNEIQLSGARNTLQVALTEAVQNLAAARQAEKELRERIVRAENYIRDRDEKITGLERIVEEFRTRAEQKDRELAAITEKQSATERILEEKRQEIIGVQERLKAEFENIATKVLRANASELSDISQREITAILDPLRERIREFEGKIDSAYESERREVLSLKDQIKLVTETTQNLGSKADGLASALKGDVQMLGRWGELVLERILGAAGLAEGREYVTQGRELGLRNEDGDIQKPDVIVLLPEGRSIIIDCKVTLASYERLTETKESAERLQHSASFLRDMKAHIDGLAQKRYQDNDQLAAHDCVLMFVPIEGALAAALTAEPDLFVYAWQKRVVLVGPSTLLMTLRTVSSIWRYERQNRNAHEIASTAAKLHDKLAALVDELNDVSRKIRDAALAHDSAMKKLSLGRGNALGRALKLKALGAPAKKNIPFILIEGEKRQIDEQEEDEDEDDLLTSRSPLRSAPDA